jgi:hypothetical protein
VDDAVLTAYLTENTPNKWGRGSLLFFVVDGKLELLSQYASWFSSQTNTLAYLPQL